jgi:hypothetical protein
VTDAEALALLDTLFSGREWPEAVRRLRGVVLARGSVPLSEAARAVRTTAARLRPLVESSSPLAEYLGIAPNDITDAHRKKARIVLGQMLVGRCAEEAFAALYRAQMKTEEIELVNVATEGNDTDYRLHNGQGRAIGRVNIKFHGSQFRRAAEMVKLDPSDCFALATYKIRSALEKQEEERLAFLFAIVGVPHLTAESTGGMFPTDIIDLTAAILASENVSHKRAFEDAVVDYAVGKPLPVYGETYEKIVAASWYILSARRASLLLEKHLWQRVFALRVRSFTRVFPGAEVDMHFSLSGDLTPLTKFFEALAEGGPPRVSLMMERGEL